MLLYVHRAHKDYYGQGAQDNHLDIDTQLLSSEAHAQPKIQRSKASRSWRRRWRMEWNDVPEVEWWQKGEEGAPEAEWVNRSTACRLPSNVCWSMISSEWTSCSSPHTKSLASETLADDGPRGLEPELVLVLAACWGRQHLRHHYHIVIFTPHRYPRQCHNFYLPPLSSPIICPSIAAMVGRGLNIKLQPLHHQHHLQAICPLHNWHSWLGANHQVMTAATSPSTHLPPKQQTNQKNPPPPKKNPLAFKQLVWLTGD